MEVGDIKLNEIKGKCQIISHKPLISDYIPEITKEKKKKMEEQKSVVKGC